MDLKIDLKNLSIDSVVESLENRPQLSVEHDTNDLVDCYKEKEAIGNYTIFSVVLGTGANEDPYIQASVSIDDLEEFAHGILKKIKMVRRDYSKEIKYQNERHCFV